LGIAFSPDNSDNVVVAVVGDIDLATADQFEAALVEAFTEFSGQVVLDLAGVSFMDSQAITTLLRVHTRYDDPPRLMIRSLQPSPKRVFELTGLDRILRISEAPTPRLVPSPEGP